MEEAGQVQVCITAKWKPWKKLTSQATQCARLPFVDHNKQVLLS
jgi:hypothetical protein